MDTATTSSAHWGLKALAIVLGLVGLSLLVGGLYLIILGGSWYYALAGAGLIAAAVLMWRGEMRGIWIFVGVFIVTVIWALFEAGLNFWALEARVVAPLFLAAVAVLLVNKVTPEKGRPANTLPFTIAGVAMMAGFCAFLIAMFFPHGVISNRISPTLGQPGEQTLASGDNWSSYGRTGAATRYSLAGQITPANVGKLEQAWVAHSGDIAIGAEGEEDQNTPLFVDGAVYHCSPTSKVTAINGATGKILWSFASRADFAYFKRCRTLGYFDPARGDGVGDGGAQTPVGAAAVPASPSGTAAAPAAAVDACGPRIMAATLNAKLIALSAATGKICTSFGKDGIVDLNTGMGETPPGFYVPTTGPIIAGDKILIGGWVGDNYSVGEPSGVVRAFDARTGELAWAWDLANPGNSGLPPEGQSYTRGTPNAWSGIAFDLKLGLAYLPLGNATPDFFGGKRRPIDDEYNAAVVAVELATGKERWHYRTVNHDIWDYDLPSQPALGGAMTTKSGLTFHAGTQDYYLRAYNTETGDILWEGRLPSGAQSTPMTYFDKASGRQFVTVTAGGARYNSNDRDDWIIAYALPKGAT